MAPFIETHGTKIRWGSIGLIVVSLMLLMRALPLNDLREDLQTWIQSLGLWGPLAFAAIYVLATVLFVPGTVLTLAAGAIFGLVKGFAVVSVGSTVGASLAFLIARYLARSRVEQLARSNPRFGAIEAAISEGGWKIVALLRLSPALPFNLQNYLYGLTDLKFWRYVLTSWIAMMPGTLMYVYFGVIAGNAAAGDQSPGKWGLLGVGLVATVVASIYITRLAQRKLKERTEIQPEEVPETAAAEKPMESPGKLAGLAIAALVLLTVAIVAQFQAEAIANLLGV